MKTIASFAPAHTLFFLLLLGALCTPLLFTQADDLHALVQTCKNQWTSFLNDFSATHLQAHRTQW